MRCQSPLRYLPGAAAPGALFHLVREPVSRGISYWFFAYAMRESGSLWTTIESYDRDLAWILAERVHLPVHQ
jgi:hypothetical protein